MPKENVKIREEVTVKQFKEQFTWPEFSSNSSRDTISESPVAKSSDTSLTAPRRNVTKVIDTMKERKQRELTGRLWNA